VVSMSPASKNDWMPSASLQTLKQRARMLQSIRAFFAARHLLEVETPVLSRAAITDPHLHSFRTRYLQQSLYLQTSPEFFMKRLLAAGSGDIYQVCKVFRDDEQGSNHHPEFSMLEWYRQGFDHHALMDEMEQLLKGLMLDAGQGWQAPVRLSYRQAFLDVLAVDPLTATAADLEQLAIAQQIEIPIGMDDASKDSWLDWLMTQAIAPSFSKQGFTFLYDYPASQAALARISHKDPRVAHRFELFFAELELANGFYELTDAEEQAQRFAVENQQRVAMALPAMPVDECLLDALVAGLPDCSGVAIGLDRLLMVLLGVATVHDTLSFSLEKD